MSQYPESIPASTLRRPTFDRFLTVSLLAIAIVATFALGAFVGANIPSSATQSAPITANGAADGWEPVILAQAAARMEAAETAARLGSAQALQDGWEPVARAHGVARLQRAQALQDGWEPVIRARGVARLEGAQALQDAWEVALFR